MGTQTRGCDYGNKKVGLHRRICLACTSARTASVGSCVRSVNEAIWVAVGILGMVLLSLFAYQNNRWLRRLSVHIKLWEVIENRPNLEATPTEKGQRDQEV